MLGSIGGEGLSSFGHLKEICKRQEYNLIKLFWFAFLFVCLFAVIKYTDQEQLRGAKILFDLHSQSTPEGI